MVSRAASASITIGPAASRSALVDVAFSVTSFLITPHFSYSIVASEFSLSTFSFSTPTT